MSSNSCPACAGKLGVKATKCRCGWVMPGAPSAGAPPVKVIACSFAMCIDGAICRIWTNTGWANVCRVHYQKIERADRAHSADSLVMKQIREAYHSSPHYRRITQGDMPPGAIGNLIPEKPIVRKHGEDPVSTREPGEDDQPAGDGKAIEYTPDMPVADYERYIDGLAAP